MRTRMPGRGGRRTTRPASAAAEQLDIIARRDEQAPPRLRWSPVRRALRRASRRRAPAKAISPLSSRDRAASTSRWRAAISLSGSGGLPRFSSGASASREPRDEIGRRGKLGRRSDRGADRSDADRTLFAARTFRAARGRLRARGQAPAAGRGRGPRRIARSSAATARPGPRAPSRSNGCLSKRQQRTGASPPSAARPRAGQKFRPAYRRARRRRNLPPRYSSARARPDAAAERAVGRDQRRRLALSHRFAQRHRDGERFVLGVGGFDHGDRAHAPPRRARLEARSAALCRHISVAAAGRKSFRDQPFAAARLRQACRRRRASIPMRASNACMANCGWPGAGERSAPHRRRSVATMLRRDRYRGPAARRRHAASARWSRSIRRSPGSSRSNRRRSPARRSCAPAARPRP